MESEPTTEHGVSLTEKIALLLPCTLHTVVAFTK